jgi:hypothetical protein
MALETLHGVTEIGGFEIGNATEHGGLSKFIVVNHDTNCICFRIQNGPIKENGLNGCQVDTLIEAAKIIIEGLNKNFPCIENAMIIHRLGEALDWSEERKRNREKRGVEGLNKA